MRLNDDCIMVMACGNNWLGESLQAFFTNTEARDALEELAGDLNVRLTYPDGSHNLLDDDIITFAPVLGDANPQGSTAGVE